MALGTKLEEKICKEPIPDLMNACLFYGPRDIRYEKVQVPQIKDGEVLVKIDTALTCGTDLKTYFRGHPVLIQSIPSAFGHQFAGTIVKTGPDVKNFQAGQRIVAVNTAPCFTCRFCKKEKYSLCENLEFLNGAYAEYISIPERIVQYNMYEIPSLASFEQAAMLESLSVVLHGLEKAGVKEGDTVCVIGTGSIGLLFVALLKLQGAQVVVIGRNGKKLKIAQELGADYVFSSSSSCFLSANIVIEAVGETSAWELATEMVSPGGTVVFFGGCQKGIKVELDTYKIHYKELNMLGVFHHTPEHVKKAMGLLKNENLMEKLSSKIITCNMPLSELEEAFLLHAHGKVVQVAIKP